MDQKQLKHILEALLFVASKPLRAKDFAKILEQDEKAITEALIELVGHKKNAGIILLNNNGEFQLATNSQFSTQVKNFLNAELREKLTDTTVEVLAIIAYRQPISKAEMEAIRGVNSQYSLRHLLMRGLIEKIPNPGDARSFLYQTTTEFLMHLGVNSVSELPAFAELVENIKLPQTPALEQNPTNAAEDIRETSQALDPLSQTEITPAAAEAEADNELADDEEDSDDEDDEE